MGAESSSPEMDKRPKCEETNDNLPVRGGDNSGLPKEADVTPIPAKVDALKPELSLKRPLIREISGTAELRNKTTVTQRAEGPTTTRERCWRFKFSAKDIHLNPAIVIIAGVIFFAAGVVAAYLWL